jgi:hypothetical protein
VIQSLGHDDADEIKALLSKILTFAAKSAEVYEAERREEESLCRTMLAAGIHPHELAAQVYCRPGNPIKNLASGSNVDPPKSY